MKKTLRDELLNLPNILTYIRILGIPLVMVCIWRGEPKDCVIAGWLYSLVTVTDYLDGYLARRMNCETIVGKFLDPLADKLMVMAMLVMLVALSRVPGWLVVLVLAREMSINGLRAVASAEGLIIAASQLGKIKTALQLVAVMCLLVHYPYKVYFLGLHEAVVDFNLVGLWTLLLATIVSLISAGQYIKGFFDALDNKRSQTSETFAE
ncbi:MAG: CDP-diacylglycerol--glycerol-3-phosphate 3-phosphatidyltransferase [Bradymonadia bacterium]